MCGAVRDTCLADNIERDRLNIQGLAAQLLSQPADLVVFAGRDDNVVTFLRKLAGNSITQPRLAATTGDQSNYLRNRRMRRVLILGQLFVPERLHRIDARSAPGRSVARGERAGDQDGGRQSE